MRFTIDDGRILVEASGREIDLLTTMLGQFTELIDGRSRDPHRGELTPKDPALARLLPDPVLDDPGAATELRSLTEASLMSHKLKNAASVNDLLAGARKAPAAMGPDAELAMLKALTDLRLVLAARLGIEQDGDRGRRWSLNDRRMQTAYQWLAAVQSDLLDTMAERDR